MLIRTVAKSAPRSAMLDVAKGLAIILVVYGHALRGLTSANVIDRASWLQITDSVIYTFHMPVFFFLSGLFVRGSLAKGARHFWRSKVLLIVYPYFLWSLLQGAIQLTLAGSGATNGAMTLSSLTHLLWVPISPFWFLYALFFATLAATLTRHWRPEWLLGFSAIAFIAATFWLPPLLGDITYGTFYLALGMVARQRNWLDILHRTASPHWLTASLLALFALSAGLCHVAGIPDRLAIPAALVGIAATLSLSASLIRASAVCEAAFSLIGQASMAIYVMHILVLGFVRLVLVQALGVTDSTVLLASLTAAAVIMPIIAILGLTRLGLAGLFGLPAVPLKLRFNWQQADYAGEHTARPD